MTTDLAELRSRALASDLRRLVPDGISVVDADLDAMTTDYGRVVHRRPRVIARPHDTGEVAAVVRYARRHGITIATRAAGHSQGGQSLGECILLDMRRMSGAVHVETDGAEGCFVTEAGTTWRDVLAETVARGMIPPVLTTNHSTTTGGTHSVGGVGHSSFRFGTQADNCVGLEIVTGAGDVVCCDGDSNLELFDHALCSLGTLGVITRISHRLRRFARFTRIYELAYRDLPRLLADADRLTATDGVTYVHARCTAFKDRWIHVLSVTVEGDDHDALADDQALLRETGHVHVISRETVPYADLLRWMSTDTPLSREAAASVVRPGIDIILPASVGGAFIGEILSTVPRWLRGQVLPLVQFLRGSTLTRPMFMTPTAEPLVMLSILPSVSPDDAATMLGLLTDISAACLRAGGKHYLAGWIPFDERGWQLHFGVQWADLARLRTLYDPDGVFSNGVVPREAAAATGRAVQPPNRDASLLAATGFAHEATASTSRGPNLLSYRDLRTKHDAE
ncbi:MAG: FAD-binding oxidoreductase [bacterium]